MAFRTATAGTTTTAGTTAPAAHSAPTAPKRRALRLPALFGRNRTGLAPATAPAVAGPPQHPPPPEGAEPLAWAEGIFFGRVPLQRWNPDELSWRQGGSLYRRMLQDDQIQALVSLRRSVIAGRGWRFELPPAEGSSPALRERQQACADFLRFVLEKQLQGTFTQVLGDLMSAQVFGFSLLEKQFAPVAWQGESWWGLERLTLRPAESFTVEMDAHGAITALLQEQNGNKVPLPRERFVHHVNRPEVHAFYGESDLKACHRHWWSKENVLKFWNIYLERVEAGFVHGRIAGPLSAEEREELKHVMRNLSVQTSVITPASVELEMVTAPSTDAFERAVAARDKAMARALLVPGLLGFGEQPGSGSFAQSRTQLEAFFLVMNGVTEALADTLNEQLFRELAWWNFGLDDPPRFRFEPLTDQQRRELAQAWREAVVSGTVQPGPADEARTRHLLGYPPSAASG